MPNDSYHFPDFAGRQIIKAWGKREAQGTRPILWAPTTKPLSHCTVALVTHGGSGALRRHTVRPGRREKDGMLPGRPRDGQPGNTDAGQVYLKYGPK